MSKKTPLQLAKLLRKGQTLKDSSLASRGVVSFIKLLSFNAAENSFELVEIRTVKEGSLIERKFAKRLYAWQDIVAMLKTEHFQPSRADLNNVRSLTEFKWKKKVRLHG